MILLPTVSGVNLVYGSLIAFVISIPQVVLYTMMTQRIPRTGGDYVWLTRTFGGWLGGSLAFMGPARDYGLFGTHYPLNNFRNRLGRGVAGLHELWNYKLPRPCVAWKYTRG